MELLTVAYLLLASYAIFCLLKPILERRNQRCFVLHYECYEGKRERKLDNETCMRIAWRNKNLGVDEYRFLQRTMAGSGIGEETYGPRNVVEGREACPTLLDAHSEMDEIMFGTLDGLFKKTAVSPAEIDILVVNVSLFASTPSLASRVIHRYKMREDIKSYDLSGLGCGASIISIDLVHRNFKLYRNATAVVVSTELMGPSWYSGKDRSMMLPNCHFRAGGSAVLLTNKGEMKSRAIMELRSIVRTHIGADDEAYACCIQMEDADGIRGVQQTKFLKNAAVRALTKNLKTMLPKVLPTRELLRYAIARSLKKKTKGESSAGGIGLNLKSGMQHFSIQPTTRANIEAIGKSLGLSEYDTEPTRVALHRFGNTSSAGVWYVLGYMEAKKRLKKGDKILMMGISAGVECISGLWETTKDMSGDNAWNDSVHHYPEMLATPSPYQEKYGWINSHTLSPDEIMRALEAPHMSTTSRLS